MYDYNYWLQFFSPSVPIQYLLILCTMCSTLTLSIVSTSKWCTNASYTCAIIWTQGQIMETTPLDQTKETRAAYWLQAELLPWLYWNMCLKGLWDGPARLRTLLHLGREARATKMKTKTSPSPPQQPQPQPAVSKASTPTSTATLAAGSPRTS